MKKRKRTQVQYEQRVLTDAFSVLNALGGEITGEYNKDCLRTPHVYYTKELYGKAYQLNEQQ